MGLDIIRGLLFLFFRLIFIMLYVFNIFILLFLFMVVKFFGVDRMLDWLWGLVILIVIFVFLLKIELFLVKRVFFGNLMLVKLFDILFNGNFNGFDVL